MVTCSNYTTEVYQWLGFNIAMQTVAGYFFLVVASMIMTNWAFANHRQLTKLHLEQQGAKIVENQAKEDRTHRKCRTCCNSRGYDCVLT
ncbi:hypothetical protein JCGZ_22796 [Jatropha curcas]|uniref:3-oxo-5-alpha-steroid 4-dehydrogenase C-terminal domain-containing protein n=1 Tax=Jatropha curcas TaxID=180498 RepID=A0A067LGH2_JATCU|nr:hypothetical protein JCGZ_22796 [Jatropha curcas]